MGKLIGLFGRKAFFIGVSVLLLTTAFFVRKTVNQVTEIYTGYNLSISLGDSLKKEKERSKLISEDFEKNTKVFQSIIVVLRDSIKTQNKTFLAEARKRQEEEEEMYKNIISDFKKQLKKSGCDTSVLKPPDFKKEKRGLFFRIFNKH